MKGRCERESGDDASSGYDNSLNEAHVHEWEPPKTIGVIRCRRCGILGRRYHNRSDLPLGGLTGSQALRAVAEEIKARQEGER
jgi:hypothetical protein